MEVAIYIMLGMIGWVFCGMLALLLGMCYEHVYLSGRYPLTVDADRDRFISNNAPAFLILGMTVLVVMLCAWVVTPVVDAYVWIVKKIFRVE